MRRSRLLSTLADTFWVLVLAVVILFAFFVALGALAPGEVAGLSLAVLVLALLWVAHAVWEPHRHPGRDVATIRARERRGF